MKKVFEPIIHNIILLIVVPIVIVIALIALVGYGIASPFLYLIKVVSNKRFLFKNRGKIAVCISRGNRMRGLITHHEIFRQEFDEIVVDNYEKNHKNKAQRHWLENIDYELGFPQFIYLGKKVAVGGFQDEYSKYGNRAISKKKFYLFLQRKIESLKN
jgi:hypothetical protein